MGRPFTAEIFLRSCSRPSPRGSWGEQLGGCRHVVSGTGPGVLQPVQARLKYSAAGGESKKVCSSLAVHFEGERYPPSSCYTGFAARAE